MSNQIKVTTTDSGWKVEAIVGGMVRDTHYTKTQRESQRVAEMLGWWYGISR